MKKKILWIGLLVCMLTGLAACGGEDAPTSSTSSSSQSVSVSDSSEESSPKTDSEDDGEDVEEYCTVTFDTDGGSEVDSVEVKKGEKLIPPQTPTKSSADCEYEFLGWYQGNTEWDFEKDVVTEDMTLTAKWKVSDSYTKPFLPKD